MSRPVGYKHTPETIAKMRRSAVKYWAGRPRNTPREVRRSPEVIERIRQTLKKRWQEPEFRARHLPHTLAIQAVAAKLHRRPSVRPPKGTPEFRQYIKVASILGVDVARSLNLSAETEGAGRP
jgi:hypothetical protein